jgi:hypothetical protein
MKKLLILTAVAAAGIATNAGVAGATTAASVSHYQASYSCSCFGQFDLSGVHLTNSRFPGVDNGPTADTTTGGRDNYSGTVSDPGLTETVFTGPGGLTCDPADMWESDYNPNLFTCTWSLTVEPDGAIQGWAIYPPS